MPNSKNTGKYIAGTIMLLLAIGVYLSGRFMWNPGCSGWGALNPLCWLDVLGDLAFLVVGIYIALFAVLIFALPVDKTAWAILLFVFLTGLIINLFIPDPIPFIDEAVMMIVTGFLGFRTFSYSSGTKQIGWGF